MSEVLVLIDHVDGAVRKPTYELLTIAKRLGEPSAVFIGSGAQGADVAEKVKAYGAEKVYVVDDVESMTAQARDGRLDSVVLGVGQALPWSTAVATVQALAPGFGWDAADVAAWDRQISDFTRDSTEGVFTAEVSSTDAATITGTLVFDRASGNTTLSIAFAPVD